MPKPRKPDDSAERLGPMKVVRRAAAERKRLPPELEAFAASDERVLRTERTTPKLDDPRTVYLIPGVANRHARLVYDRRLEALRAALDDARSAGADPQAAPDTPAPGAQPSRAPALEGDARRRLGALLSEALRLGWWRGKSLTGFDALVDGVLGLPVDEAEALARAANGGRLPERLHDHAVAMVLRAEAGLAEAGVTGHIALGAARPGGEPGSEAGGDVWARLDVPVDALGRAVLGAAQLLQTLATPGDRTRPERARPRRAATTRGPAAADRTDGGGEADAETAPDAGARASGEAPAPRADRAHPTGGVDSPRERRDAGKGGGGERSPRRAWGRSAGGQVPAERVARGQWGRPKDDVRGGRVHRAQWGRTQGEAVGGSGPRGSGGRPEGDGRGDRAPRGQWGRLKGDAGPGDPNRGPRGQWGRPKEGGRGDRGPDPRWGRPKAGAEPGDRSRGPRGGGNRT
jgi:hypothetical protein